MQKTMAEFWDQFTLDELSELQYAGKLASLVELSLTKVSKVKIWVHKIDKESNPACDCPMCSDWFQASRKFHKLTKSVTR